MANETMNSDFPDSGQRYAVCISQWDEAHKMASDNTTLIEQIRARNEKRTEFGYGILTADRWVKNMQQVVGLDVCYKFASKNNVSFDDALRKASQTLTYSNPDMVVEEKVANFAELKDIKLPKNTLMAFRHVLTTPRKDRDGDVLRTDGAMVDPKMLLLWQHVHTLPIGKMLAVVEHNPKKLVLISAIVDMNELSHDAAVMVDNDMARFSHGFRALEFEELKESEGETTGPGGFDVKRFEIMEESIVSVPSNADAEVAEVLVSLVEGGKLTSGILKEYGKTIRNQMPITVAFPEGLGAFVTVMKDAREAGEISRNEFRKEDSSDENESRDRGFEAEGKGASFERTASSSSEKARAVEAQKENFEHQEVVLTARMVQPFETKHFDVELEHLEASKLEYEWASRWLNCQIKEMEVVQTFVPRFRMGSFLTGVKTNTSNWEVRDIRNLTYSGKEEPPFHEVVQLNSRLSDTFLISGIEFMKTDSGDHVCVKRTPEYNGMYITTYVKRGSKSGNDLIDKSWDWAHKNNFLRGEAFCLSGDFIKREGGSWDDVFLDQKNKAPLQRLVKSINNDQSNMPNRGIVAMGPPGTGKTLSGRVILNEAKATFIWVAAKDFWRMGAVGGLCSAFDLAKELSPAVIFVEDVDNWMSDYAIDVLKTEMDGVSKTSGISTILTTNYPERFPDALIDRPGRFHDVLLFNLPDAKVRREMLVKWAEDIQPMMLEKLVKKTEGYSGAHVYELVTFAKSLQKETEGLEIGYALEKAIDKINEQRNLIDQAQLAGSNYRPRRDIPVKVKSYLEQLELNPVSKLSEQKAGRSLSKKNRMILKEVHDDLMDVCENEHSMSRGSKALCERCAGRINKMIDEEEDETTVETSTQEITSKEAMAIFIAQSSDDEKARMLSILEIFKRNQEQGSKAKQYKALLGL